MGNIYTVDEEDDETKENRRRQTMKKWKTNLEAENKSAVIRTLFFPDQELKPMTYDLCEAKIVDMTKQKNWTLLKLEFFSRDFLFHGDLTNSFEIGQFVDLKYYWDGKNEKKIYISSIQPTGIKNKYI